MIFYKIIAEGGWVMWPLCFIAAALWFCLGYRWHLYRQYSKIEFSADKDLFFFEKQKPKFKTLIKSLLLISPLLGLLGTVCGMIETFDSLGDMQLYSQSGGIASGISKALFTTQMGLVISAPGLVFNRYIEKKIQALSMNVNMINLNPLSTQQDLSFQQKNELQNKPHEVR